MLTLSQGAFSIDLSRNVTSYNFDVTPSFSFNELMNGNITKKTDLGSNSDKFFCDLELCLSFTELSAFNTFYRNVSNGSSLDISTDLDLFFPNKTNNLKCSIVDIRDLGYLENEIMSKRRMVLVRLYLAELQTYTPTTNTPNCFSKGMWTQEYIYSDKFNLGMVGVTSIKSTFKNDSNIWVVSFNLLKRSEVNEMVSWILTKRTDDISITTNDVYGSKTSNYNIRSFEFKNDTTFYSGSLELVERTIR